MFQRQPIETDQRLLDAVQKLPGATILRQSADDVLVQTRSFVGLVRWHEGWVTLIGYSTEAFDTLVYGNYSASCGWMFHSTRHAAKTYTNLKRGIK